MKLRVLPLLTLLFTAQIYAQSSSSNPPLQTSKWYLTGTVKSFEYDSNCIGPGNCPYGDQTWEVVDIAVDKARASSRFYPGDTFSFGPDDIRFVKQSDIGQEVRVYEEYPKVCNGKEDFYIVVKSNGEWSCSESQ